MSASGRVRAGVSAATQMMALVALLVTGCADSSAPLLEPGIANGQTTATTMTRTAPAVRWSPDSAIKVDQFGYRPQDPKWAVLADPRDGYNADLAYTPGSRLELRRAGDDGVEYSGTPVSWNDGAVHDQSGDRGWWFDFSEVRRPGTYYLVDVEAEVASPRFVIADDVYDDVLKAALKVFWYNRGNVAHPEDVAGPWNDDAAFVGPGQDTEARWVDDRLNPSTERDLSGGWFDAGDTNKYVVFASEPVHLLLTAFQRASGVFDDAVGIPESGNGIPDVLDEVRWELDWLERMQNDDGGVLVKVGVVELEGQTTPSESRLPRFYEEACSSSTIVAAGMFAHASIVFRTIPELAEDAERLEERAVLAWNWYRRNPVRVDCDAQIIWAGDADLSLEDHRKEELVSAVYLFALTGDETYHDTIKTRFKVTEPFIGDGFGHYGPDQADALVVYGGLPSASQQVVDTIENRMTSLVSESPMFGMEAEADLYRSYLPDNSYHWGSNMVKANAGTANMLTDPDDSGGDRAHAHLHYFHGLNPLGLCYLSNMGDLGAESSVRQLFHYWFGDGSPYDESIGSTIGVPPGYVVGGPNQFYSGTNSPPADQPAQKSYLDWAANGSQPLWEITEPAIYYQGAYVRLLAEIMAT